MVGRVLAASLCVSVTALAGPKALTVAVGDCRDAELVSGATAFTEAVSGVLKADAIDPTLVLDRLRPRPESNLDDVKRQLEGARSQFFADQFDRTLDGVRSAVTSLERLPPSDDSAIQLQAAWMLEGLVYKSLNRKNEQFRAWRRVLRTAPNFKLDPNTYSPSAVAQFEQLRAEGVKAKKVSLTIRSAPAAIIFIDGIRAGLAPIEGTALLPGNYRVVAVAGDAQSFVHEVKLDAAPVEVAIDLSFEGSLRPRLPLCVNGSEAEAIKLAAREGADRVLVFRVDATAWVTSVLFDVSTGARVRDGGMKISEARQGTGYSDLASFVLTGQPARLALANRSAEVETPAAAPAPVPVAPVVEPKKPEPIVVAQPVSAPSAAPRAIPLVVAGAGVVAAGVGLGVYLSAGADRALFASAVDSRGVLDQSKLDAQNAATLEQRLHTNEALSAGLMIGGGVAAATGVVLFFALAPSDAPKPMVMVSPDGAYVGVNGSF